MAEIVMTDYLGMLERSRLFESRAKIDEYLGAWRAEVKPEDPEDVHALAEWLIQKEYLTQWQSDNIFAGKYKGFFLGQYKLLRAIGAGGMSSVYLAVHTILERQVAIKVLPKSRVTSDSSYLERFLLEAQAVAALDHPNIVRAYDVDTEGNSIYYLVMEYIDGPDLLSLVKKEGPMEMYRAAKYIRQAATGLHHAHMAGLIHRDMKPANLLVDKEDNVHVLDLGLARFTDEKRTSLTLTYDENVLGTADYLAPEQARNSHNVDARADIYGLGCTLYYLLVGHVPFPEGTLAQRIAAHQKRMPTRIQEERPDIPDDLAEICWKMMAKDPNDRQQTAEEVADDLTCWLLEHGQKVEGFTGSLSSLQRKKEAESEQKLGFIQSDAQKELDALAEIASLANVTAKTSEDSKAFATHKTAVRDAKPIRTGSLFTALEKFRQKMGDGKKIAVNPAESGKHDGTGTSAKRANPETLDFSSWQNAGNSDSKADSLENRGSDSKKADTDFGSTFNFEALSTSVSGSGTGSDSDSKSGSGSRVKSGSGIKLSSASDIKSGSGTKHAGTDSRIGTRGKTVSGDSGSGSDVKSASGSSISSRQKSGSSVHAASASGSQKENKPEKKAADSSFLEFIAPQTPAKSTAKKEGSSTNNVLDFSSSEAASASTSSHASSASHSSSVMRSKTAGSSVSKGKKSPSKVVRNSGTLPADSGRKGSGSSKKLDEKVLYAAIALGFFIILLILALFSM